MPVRRVSSIDGSHLCHIEYAAGLSPSSRVCAAALPRQLVQLTSGIVSRVKPPQALHQKKIPAFADGFLFDGLFVTLKNTEFPREDREESFFPVGDPVFRMDDLSVPKAYQASVLSTSHMHSARAPTDAYELDDVVKTRIRERTGEAS